MASILKFDEWQNTAGVKYGTVLQVVSAFDNTHYVFNAGSSNQVTFYNVTGLSVNITPRSTTSRILLMASVGVGQTQDSYNIYLRFARNGTGIGTSDSRGIYVAGGSAMVGYRTFAGGSGNYSITALPMCFVDSPASTSQLTYNVQVCNSGGGTSPSYINRQQATDTTWAQAMASNIIAMEIQG
jgi:hypothetical protein